MKIDRTLCLLMVYSDHNTPTIYNHEYKKWGNKVNSHLRDWCRLLDASNTYSSLVGIKFAAWPGVAFGSWIASPSKHFPLLKRFLLRLEVNTLHKPRLLCLLSSAPKR